MSRECNGITTLTEDELVQAVMSDLASDVLSGLDNLVRAGLLPPGSGFDKGVRAATKVTSVRILNGTVYVNWTAEVDTPTDRSNSR